MKPAEMEAMLLKQEAAIQAMQEAHMHLVQRADNIVEGFKKELAVRDEALKGYFEDFQKELVDRDVRLADLTARLADIEVIVTARNSSAATKRNMTDDDALRVLKGDLNGLSHKDAAEKAGLTYAQVYSCRLEFTFKHIHKALRDASTAENPWVNPWSK